MLCGSTADACPYVGPGDLTDISNIIHVKVDIGFRGRFLVLLHCSTADTAQRRHYAQQCDYCWEAPVCVRIRPSSAEGDPFCACRRALKVTRRQHLCFLNGQFQRHHSGPHHMRIVLARKACMGPNSQDRAVHLVATTGHLFQDMMAICH